MTCLAFNLNDKEQFNEWNELIKIYDEVYSIDDKHLEFKFFSSWSELNKLSLTFLVEFSKKHTKLFLKLVSKNIKKPTLHISFISSSLVKAIIEIFNQKYSNNSIFLILFDEPDLILSELFSYALHLFDLMWEQNPCIHPIQLESTMSEIQIKLSESIKGHNFKEFETGWKKYIKKMSKKISQLELSTDKINSSLKSEYIENLNDENTFKAATAVEYLQFLLLGEEEKLEKKSSKEIKEKLKGSSSSIKKKNKEKGWAYLTPHLKSLFDLFVQSTQYQNFSYILPHLKTNFRILVNGIIRLIYFYVKQFPSGFSNLDQALKSNKIKDASPYETFFQLLSMNNSNSTEYILFILVEHMQKDSDLLSNFISQEFFPMISAHFEFQTENQVKLILGIEDLILQRAIKMSKKSLEPSNHEHQKQLIKLWNMCMSSSGQKLDSIISNKWKFLGFNNDDPFNQIKDYLHLYLLSYLSQNHFKKLDNILVERLFLKKQDYNFIEIALSVVDIVLVLISKSLKKFEIKPILYSSSFAFEEIYCASFFHFEIIWNKNNFLNTKENVKSSLIILENLIDDNLNLSDSIFSFYQNLENSEPTKNLIKIKKRLHKSFISRLISNLNIKKF